MSEREREKCDGGRNGQARNEGRHQGQGALLKSIARFEKEDRLILVWQQLRPRVRVKLEACVASSIAEQTFASIVHDFRQYDQHMGP